MPDDTFTIVLAAGEGTRLQSLTRALHGEDVPKQFALIHPDRSLLQATVARATRWSRPERIVVVVAQNREGLARSQLARHEGIDIVVQPRNLGTGPGLLLPLARVLARDPAAHVVVLPSDHHVRDPDVFEHSVRRAEASSRSRGSIVLIGATPDRAETEYGWIMTSPGDATGVRVIARFHEKPRVLVARRLLRDGGLWNTFILAGAASDFWKLGSKHLPKQCCLLENQRRDAGAPWHRDALASLYERLAPGDFSHDVLEVAEGLEVVPLGACGWSDWGTPVRVLGSLRGTADLAVLTRRLRASVQDGADPGATALALALIA